MAKSPKDKLKAIGANIRYLRLAKGWTQQDLADHTSLDSFRISRIENGANSRTETLIQIAEALEVPLHILVLIRNEKK